LRQVQKNLVAGRKISKYVFLTICILYSKQFAVFLSRSAAICIPVRCTSNQNLFTFGYKYCGALHLFDFIPTIRTLVLRPVNEVRMR
jgi:hypothetical protein